MPRVHGTRTGSRESITGAMMRFGHALRRLRHCCGQAANWEDRRTTGGLVAQVGTAAIMLPGVVCASPAAVLRIYPRPRLRPDPTAVRKNGNHAPFCKMCPILRNICATSAVASIKALYCGGHLRTLSSTLVTLRRYYLAMPTQYNSSAGTSPLSRRHPEYFFHEADTTFKVCYYTCFPSFSNTISCPGRRPHLQSPQEIFSSRILLF